MSGSQQALPTNEPTVSPNNNPDSGIPTSGGPTTVAQQPPPPTGADDSPKPAPAAAAPAPQGQGVPTAAPAGPVTPVATSEPAQVEAKANSAPTVSNTPPIDPRPYAILARDHPDVKAVVDSAALTFGVAPETIAGHMYLENSFRMADAPTSRAGAVGPMQVKPATADEINQHFGTHLNVNDPKDNVALGAAYIRMNEDKYGVGTPLRSFAYQSGPGKADNLAADPSLASKFPEGMKYTNAMHGNANIDPASFSAQGNSQVTPRGLVLAGTQGGPSGFLSYIAQAKPQNMTMSDAWQHAEGELTEMFVRRGDMAGAQKAQDFVFNMSHQGSNMALQGAYKALSVGVGVSAAKFLAQAHAFFPDGGMGQFGVDSKGQVWAQNMDEKNPTKPLGPPFMVTPQAIATMMNQTADPQQFLETLQKQQSANANMRLAEQHGNYYAGLNQERENAAELRSQTALAVEHERAQTAIATHSAAGGQSGANAINKETETNYSADAMPDATPETRMGMAQLHAELRRNGADPITANTIATGGIGPGGKYQVRPQSDGSYAVVDPKNPTVPLATVGASMITHLAGARGIPTAEPGAKSPVGAGGGSPVAALGMTTNLAGSQPSQQGTPPPQQPQGIPTPQPQP